MDRREKIGMSFHGEWVTYNESRSEQGGRFSYIWVIEREWIVVYIERKVRSGSKCVGVKKKKEELEIQY